MNNKGREVWRAGIPSAEQTDHRCVGRTVFVATGWLQIWGSLESCSTCFLFPLKQHRILLTHAHCFVFSRLPGFSGACSSVFVGSGTGRAEFQEGS